MKKAQMLLVVVAVICMAGCGVVEKFVPKPKPAPIPPLPSKTYTHSPVRTIEK